MFTAWLCKHNKHTRSSFPNVIIFSVLETDALIHTSYEITAAFLGRKYCQPS